MPTAETPLEQHLLRERGRLLAFIRSRIDDPELAEDVLQESFLKALRAAPDLHDEERVTAWLYQIVRNAITDTYRRRATARDARERYAVEQEGADVVTPEDEAALCGCVRDVVPTLTPAYAAVVEADLTGRTTEELTAELGITPNNLKVRRHRAHRQLRERLEQTCRLCATHGCLDCTCRTRA